MCHNSLGKYEKFLISEDFSIGQKKEFVCVEVLQPSQSNGIMSSVVSLLYQTFTGQD